MSTFLTNANEIIKADRLEHWPHLHKGFHWENAAPLGHSPLWQEVPFEIETLEHKETLFGYETKVFLDWQYK